jgi:hypothetical protein
MSLVGEIAPVIEVALDETARLPFAHTVDIGPGLGCVEREIIGGDANDGAFEEGKHLLVSPVKINWPPVVYFN